MHPLYTYTPILIAPCCQGYYGGLRLLLATCKVFSNHCVQRGLQDRIREGFRLSYTTSIPRMVSDVASFCSYGPYFITSPLCCAAQVGLSGSSAIVCATFRALMKYYNISLSDLLISKEGTFVCASRSMQQCHEFVIYALRVPHHHPQHREGGAGHLGGVAGPHHSVVRRPGAHGLYGLAASTVLRAGCIYATQVLLALQHRCR